MQCALTAFEILSGQGVYLFTCYLSLALLFVCLLLTCVVNLFVLLCLTFVVNLCLYVLLTCFVVCCLRVCCLTCLLFTWLFVVYLFIVFGLLYCLLVLLCLLSGYFVCFYSLFTCLFTLFTSRPGSALNIDPRQFYTQLYGGILQLEAGQLISTIIRSTTSPRTHEYHYIEPIAECPGLYCIKGSCLGAES